jgi:hypothetical protein
MWNYYKKPVKKPTPKALAPARGSETDSNGGSDEASLQRRLKAAKRRLAYHSRPGAGASRTAMPAGEAKSLAKADVAQLTYFIKKLRAEKGKSLNAPHELPATKTL